VNPIEPGLLAPASFNINGVQYVFASFADGTYVPPAGAISGVNSRTAKPGDLLTLYGVGFGPVTPAAGDGQIEQQLNTLASSFAIKLGGAPVTASYDGLAPQAVGLYQFNITVPAVASGNAALTFSVGEESGTQTLYVPMGD
jgi:uncharacterized protein (TIGR03437 family)